MTKPVTASPGQSLSVEKRMSREKAARAVVPRATHGEWTAPADRDDHIVMLVRQAAPRVPDLIPIRCGRMAPSLFSFFRGAALPIATDLGATKPVGIEVTVRRRASGELRRLRRA